MAAVEEDERKYKEKAVISSHYPSSLFACPRQQFYSWKRLKRSNPPNGDKIIVMETGNKVEEMIMNYLKLADCKPVGQVELKAELDGCLFQLSGKIDGVFEIAGEKMIIEVKSGAGRYIANMRLEGAPRKEHANQTAAYLVYNKLGITKAFIFYQARDSSMQLEYFFELKNGKLYMNGNEWCEDIERWKHKVSGWCRDVEVYFLNNTLPAKSFFASIKNGEIKDFQKDNVIYSSDWQCDYCAWADICWKEEIDKYSAYDNAMDAPDRCKKNAKAKKEVKP